MYDGEVQTPKTANAYRVINLKPGVLDLIKQYVSERKTGLIFLNKREGGNGTTAIADPIIWATAAFSS